MEVYTIPTLPPTFTPFLPFNEHPKFELYESISKHFLVITPIAALVICVVGAIIVVVRAKAEGWYYWCVRWKRGRSYRSGAWL